MFKYSKILFLVLFLVAISSCKSSILKLQEAKEICPADKGIIPAKTASKVNKSPVKYQGSDEDILLVKDNDESQSEGAVIIEQPENPIQSQRKYPGLKSETENRANKTKLKTSSIQTEAEVESGAGAVAESANPDNLIKSSPEFDEGIATAESYTSQLDTKDVHCNKNDTASSSCLSPAGLELEGNNEVIKVPAGNKGNRARKRKMGSVFPASILEYQESNELIVKGDISIEEIENLIEDNPIKNTEVLNTGEGILCKLVFTYPLKAGDYNKFKDHLITETGIASFEPNFYINDLAMEANSSIHTIDLLAEDWAIRDLGLRFSEGGNEVIVAVIDTGVDYYKIPVLPGWNFVDNNNDPMDYHGHGTHIAGIIGNCKIMPLKALDNDGAGNSWNLAEAIIYAVDNGAKVINMSWGSSIKSMAIDYAIDYAYRNGVILCAAAGNNGADTPLYPASNRNVISVGANDICGIPTRWSNAEADFICPGKDISSTSIHTEHEYKSGTSMSTAYVSKIAALFLEKNPDSSPMEFLYNARIQAKENTSLNGFGLQYPEYFVSGCNRILSADVDEITVLTYGDIEYSLLEYKRDGENNWTTIAQIPPGIEEIHIAWDRSRLQNGLYKIRLSQFAYDGKVRAEVTDTMFIEITDGLPNNESTSHLFWGWCKIDNMHDSYILVNNSNIEITPSFFVNGKQVFSPFTGITQRFNTTLNLADYLPDSIKEYEGFIVLDVTGDSEISLVTKNMVKKLIRIDESAKNLGAEWYLPAPSKNQQDNLRNAFFEYPENRDSFEDYKFGREATIELGSFTNETDSAYITFSADNVGFRPANLWYWSEDNEYYFYIPGGVSYNQSVQIYNHGESYRFPAYSEVHKYCGESLISVITSTTISLLDLSEIAGEENEEYLEFEAIMNYLFPYSGSYRLVAKLGDRLDAEYINLVINRPYVVSGNISVKTWSFLEGPDVPINFFWANRCEVSSNGGLFGAVVVREHGEVVDFIPLCPQN